MRPLSYTCAALVDVSARQGLCQHKSWCATSASSDSAVTHAPLIQSCVRVGGMPPERERGRECKQQNGNTDNNSLNTKISTVDHPPCKRVLWLLKRHVRHVGLHCGHTTRSALTHVHHRLSIINRVRVTLGRVTGANSSRRCRCCRPGLVARSLHRRARGHRHKDGAAWGAACVEGGEQLVALALRQVACICMT